VTIEIRKRVTALRLLSLSKMKVVF